MKALLIWPALILQLSGCYHLNEELWPDTTEVSNVVQPVVYRVEEYLGPKDGYLATGQRLKVSVSDTLQYSVALDGFAKKNANIIDITPNVALIQTPGEVSEFQVNIVHDAGNDSGILYEREPTLAELKTLLNLSSTAVTPVARGYLLDGAASDQIGKAVLAIGKKSPEWRLLRRLIPEGFVKVVVNLSNTCSKAVSISVAAKKPGFPYQVHGWFNFSPGETAPISLGLSGTDHFYYYGYASNGANGSLVWEGNANDPKSKIFVIPQDRHNFRSDQPPSGGDPKRFRFASFGDTVPDRDNNLTYDFVLSCPD